MAYNLPLMLCLSTVVILSHAFLSKVNSMFATTYTRIFINTKYIFTCTEK